MSTDALFGWSSSSIDLVAVVFDFAFVLHFVRSSSAHGGDLWPAVKPHGTVEKCRYLFYDLKNSSPVVRQTSLRRSFERLSRGCSRQNANGCLPFSKICFSIALKHRREFLLAYPRVATT